MTVATSGERYSVNWSAGLGALLLAVAASGCSDLDPALDTCNTSESCIASTVAELGPPLYERDPERWGCLAPNFQRPQAPPIDPNATFIYTAVLADYAMLTPLRGAKMSFCTNQDESCSGAPSVTVAEDVNLPPVASLPIRAGITGFLRLEAVDHVTQDYYLLAPMVANTQLRAQATDPFTLVSLTSLAVFIRDVNTNVDQRLGIMALEIRDCRGNRVEGARLNLPERASRPDLQSADYYAIDQRFPVIDVPTDGDGIAGWINLPDSGTVEVEAVVDGQAFGRTRLRTQGGRITGGVIRPDYSSAF